MTTIKNIEVYKDLPILITSKARGYYDYSEIKTFINNEPYTINQQIYDGLSYEIYNSNINPKTIKTEVTTLPDGSFVNSQTTVLMPYDNGKVYHNVEIEKKYVYFNNYGCTISNDKLLSGFSTSNYAQINKTFPSTFTSFKAIFKITTGSSLTSHHNCVFGNNGSSNVSVIIRDTKKFSYYTGSWVEGKTALNANTTYWFCVNYANNNFTGYILADNGSYTLNTLPDLSQWSTEWTSSTNIFAGNIFNIGYNKNSTSEFFTGSFDLNNCKIWVNNEEFWYYDEISLATDNFNGCLYNYTDTGVATTLNCFYYSNKYLLTADEDITDGIYLGQVEIPVHDVYNYSETLQTVYDNFSIIGTTISLDQETGKVSGFSLSSYLDTGYIPNLPANTPWKMRVKFKYSTVSSSQYYFTSKTYSSGPYIATGSSGNLSCGISSNGTQIETIQSTFTLQNNSNYIVEWVYDGDQTYTLRCKKEDASWETVGTVTYNSLISYTNSLRVGASVRNYCRGVIDLSNDTYFEIDGTKTWLPTTTHYNTTWTKQ